MVIIAIRDIADLFILSKQLNKHNWEQAQTYRIVLSEQLCFYFFYHDYVISIGNSPVSRGICDKYREWYFKIHQNITSRRGGEWYLGSFEISRAGIYPKYPEETVLFPVYTKRKFRTLRNFALYVTPIILFGDAQLIGFTTTCD